MNEAEKMGLKQKIDQVSLVSFDIFDTLLFRKTNTPETVFDLVGKHFGIHGFRKLRMDEQDEASRRTYARHQYPHADMDEIYEVLSEHTEIPVDWNEVKEFEIQLEQDALMANEEMLEIFRYVKAQGKRVVATSDMYLQARILKRFLEANGFVGFDHVYCSADEHTAKFNKKLFETVAQSEGIPYEEILHIGDKERDDGEYPAEYGMQTFVYHRDAQLDKLKSAGGSDIDNGLYKILYRKEKGFWYNLGVEVGGPIYMGLYRYLAKKAADGKKIYFLARDGYNLYHIFKELGYQNIEYVYTSRRALMMASIQEMNERAVKSLPPHTFGQTVGELLDYLCVERSDIQHLNEAGFESFDDVICTAEDSANFRKLYLYDKEVFLAQCEKEREYAKQYFDSIGFLEQDGICFDCGWQGSSQELIESFKKAVGCKADHPFVYFGIRNGEKSRKQLHGMHYDTYLFDFYKNYGLQEDLNQNVVMYELFFSAPHESVYYYGENGTVVFEDGAGDQQKKELLDGILAFIKTGLEFVEKYDVEYTPETAVGHLKRLIFQPTEEEAVTIGNLQNVDGFARKQGLEKYIAFLTKERLDDNFNYDEVYWLKGLLKRSDVDDEVKKICAEELGSSYPEKIPEYHLEDGGSIRTYHRWLKHQDSETSGELPYQPKFSIVIPVYNTVTEQLEECIESVLAQTYTNFELILVDDHSSWENVVPVLRRYEAQDNVSVIYRHENGHISKATNDGIFASTGDFIVFMDCDDTIEPNALAEFARKLNENPELDFIYSDEDKITEDGKIRHMPFFKPDWSPDLFLSMMYTNHLATYRASIVKKIGGLRTAYNGSQDYDFTLRFMEQSDHKRVGHVSKILYHWRERKESVAFALSSKNYASEAARYAKEDYIRRNHLNAEMECITKMSQYRIVYHVTGTPLVSIIIPSKDHPDILKQCVDSIREFTAYPNYEIIVVDNGSSKENKNILEHYLAEVEAVYIYEKEPFNFSKMCNTGAAHAKGEYLLFLNDDIEIFQPEWMERMLGQAQQKHTGAVGAKLFYPDTTLIQHSGISNPKNGPMHNFLGCDDQAAYYFGLNWVDYNCIAVTGACLMTAKEKFEEVGGFDEAFPVAYNDVKLCFELHEKGYYNVVRNDVCAYHYESLSRGTDILDEKKRIRLNQERTNLFAEFPHLKNRDPYHSVHMKVLGKGLRLEQDYEQWQEMDLSGCEPLEEAYFDDIFIGERIQINGWCMLEGEDHIEELERWMVFEDSYGRTYGARAIPHMRSDVAEYLGDDKYQFVGFESVLRRNDLRIDLMVYRLGVMVIGRDGTRYLKWCRNIEIERNPKNQVLIFENNPLENFELHDRQEAIPWSLEQCEQKQGYWFIKGFAFKNSWDHYRYETSLILLGSDGTASELDIQPEERLDIAYAFPEQHFLYYTGFSSYLFDSTLKPGVEYELVIRVKSLYDPMDWYDIMTGQKIRR